MRKSLEGSLQISILEIQQHFYYYIQFRSTLQNRGTETVIVLLQSSPPLPVGEASNINSERAATLCAACELPRLNLFVLPFTQRPQGFIIKYVFMCLCVYVYMCVYVPE